MSGEEMEPIWMVAHHPAEDCKHLWLVVVRVKTYSRSPKRGPIQVMAR
jgi:hypothetical protein